MLIESTGKSVLAPWVRISNLAEPRAEGTRSTKPPRVSLEIGMIGIGAMPASTSDSQTYIFLVLETHCHRVASDS